MNSTVVNFINLKQNFKVSEDDLRHFWDLEAIGISANHDRSLSAKESKLLEDFQTSFRMEGQRRVVSRRRKQNIALPSNKLNAEKRPNLTKRLESNETLKQIYQDKILNYITRGKWKPLLREDPTSTVFYLPH